MREYNYSDIVRFDKMGILFSDNVFIAFEECRNEWAKENSICVEDTVCVALRFLEGNNRYYIFYTKDKVKLCFEFKGILKKKRSRNKFSEMQVLLNHYGYTSYDRS